MSTGPVVRRAGRGSATTGWLTLAGLLVVTGCGDWSPRPERRMAIPGGAHDSHPAADAPLADEHPDGGSEGADAEDAHDDDAERAGFLAGTPITLAAVAGDTVVGRVGPDGRPFEVALRTPAKLGHDRIFGRRTFGIALREEELAHYPCSSCHLPGRPVVQPVRIEDAHQNIQPVHPEETGAQCMTCHAVDDPQLLALENGERVTLDHAYRLCAQCHFTQVEDWAGGAHGKRLDAWRGRRVVMGCAECHDPHRPSLAPRLPFPGPRIPRTPRPR